MTVLLPHSGRAMPSRPTTFANRILSRLSAIDFALLEPHLTAVDLPLRKQLEVPQKPINFIYFIESGYASVVADGTGKRGIEVGLIGREGMTGLAVVMATDRTHHETFIQYRIFRTSRGVLRVPRSREPEATFLLFLRHEDGYVAASNPRYFGSDCG